MDMARPTYRGFSGHRLRELRVGAQLTQEQLAIRVGVFPSMVGKYERGQVEPEPPQVQRLARELGVSPRQLTEADLTQGTVRDLRFWSCKTRPEAAAEAGMSERRLFNIEHLTQRPTDEWAAALARVYGVEPSEVVEAWDRERSALYSEVAAR
jgi:DNA-binding XRE family transcriptional regulator